MHGSAQHADANDLAHHVRCRKAALPDVGGIPIHTSIKTRNGFKSAGILGVGDVVCTADTRKQSVVLWRSTVFLAPTYAPKTLGSVELAAGQHVLVSGPCVRTLCGSTDALARVEHLCVREPGAQIFAPCVILLLDRFALIDAATCKIALGDYAVRSGGAGSGTFGISAKNACPKIRHMAGRAAYMIDLPELDARECATLLRGGWTEPRARGRVAPCHDLPKHTFVS